MSTLHTISKSPKSQLLSECLPLVNKGDGILFIEDGVYYCVNNKLLNDFELDITWYGLKEDVDARGLKLDDIKAIHVINYKIFVEMCEEFDKVISWF
jgi:sulfur relay protein TusB/DsrH